MSNSNESFLKEKNEKEGSPKIITIDHTKPFDPAAFFGAGWKTADTKIEDALHPLLEVDPAKIQLETMVTTDERFITREEKIRRLKEAGYTLLDATVARALFFENPHSIPKSWKERVDGRAIIIAFDGTELISPFGDHCTPCLYWGDDDRLNWYSSTYDNNVLRPSAV
ncbi:hypothetical protein EXS57_00475, partial [Candidatus Kaiserbacteria bacterium]|nr:hypothetical protein [Candidatus Kaiserbacteria bacterium]